MIGNRAVVMGGYRQRKYKGDLVHSQDRPGSRHHGGFLPQHSATTNLSPASAQWKVVRLPEQPGGLIDILLVSAAVERAMISVQLTWKREWNDRPSGSDVHLQRVRIKGAEKVAFTKPFMTPFGRLYGTLDAFRAANLEALLGRLEYMSIRAEQMLEKSDHIAAHVVHLQRFSSSSQFVIADAQ